jgi:hypothetical protein
MAVLEDLARHENALRALYVTAPTDVAPFPALRADPAADVCFVANSDLRHLDLTGYDLRFADLARRDLSTCHFERACFTNANVEETFFGEQTSALDLADALGDPAEPLSCGCDPDNEAACEHCGECSMHCNEHNDGFSCEHGHRVCSQASNRRDRPQQNTSCSCCNYCERHCDCMSCGNCGERTSPDNWEGCRGNGDHSCAYCSECCSCSDEDDEGPSGSRPPYASRALTFHAAKTFKVNPARRFIACEIEVPAVEDWTDVDFVLKTWKASLVEDGSLYGSRSAEITTAPASGDKFSQQIGEICAALKSGGLQEDTEKKCGLHVHVDVRDYRWQEIRRLCAAWEKVEAAMWQLVAPSRKGSQWCAPSVPFCSKIAAGKADPQKAVAEAFYQDDWGRMKARARDLKREAFAGIKGERRPGVRYTALNLHSILYRGTVECRMHHGSWDAKKIIAFSRVFEAIVSWAYKANEKMLTDLPADPWAALMSIVPADLHPWCVKRRADLHGIGGEIDLAA